MLSAGIVTASIPLSEIVSPEVILTANAAESGKCGKNLTWVLDDGTLTISGTGEMTVYFSCESPFYNNQDIKNIVIEYEVTSIGAYAFCECASLNGKTIPESVTGIGDDAFYGCTSLTSITIPNSVISIENVAFSSCRILTSITIPDSVTSIAEETFYGCTSLTEIMIPDSAISIGDYAFEDCADLTRLCEKISVNSKTVIKTLSCERLENSRSDFFTVYNGYCNLSRFFGYQPAGMERSGMESG